MRAATVAPVRYGAHREVPFPYPCEECIYWAPPAGGEDFGVCSLGGRLTQVVDTCDDHTE